MYSSVNTIWVLLAQLWSSLCRQVFPCVKRDLQERKTPEIF